MYSSIVSHADSVVSVANAHILRAEEVLGSGKLCQGLFKCSGDSRDPLHNTDRGGVVRHSICCEDCRQGREIAAVDNVGIECERLANCLCFE
jgi:hypothetical protein